MRKSFGAKPYLYPQPVLIIASYDENGVPDAMNAACGGISDMAEISMSLSASHKTVKNIKAKKAFTVSMATAEYVVACDYLGVESANKVPNKLEKAGLHVTKSELVDAPIIDELPMVLECEMIDYNDETEILRGKIVNVSADEKVLGEDGQISLDKFHPITYDPVHHGYYSFGEKAGNAFQDGAKLK